MALKTFKPTSPGRRQLVLVDRSDLHQGRPEKTLVEGLTKKGGRNNTGRITARRRGGGAKRLYRQIDFKRRKFDVPATVERLEYDPNRTAFIALVKYEDGELSYMLAPQRLAVGDTIVASDRVEVKPGNAMPLKNMPVGTIIHNVELKPMKGGQIARSAGAYAQLVGRDSGYAQVRLMSGELRMVHQDVPGHRRRGVQSGPPEHQSRQGWPHPPYGQAPGGSRRGHEPGRSPARRRRRPHLGRPSPGHPLGQADQRSSHPLQQEDR
jgi:large subunit ribosomal protein L2